MHIATVSLSPSSILLACSCLFIKPIAIIIYSFSMQPSYIVIYLKLEACMALSYSIYAQHNLIKCIETPFKISRTTTCQAI